jgi:hypothetical protein
LACLRDAGRSCLGTPRMAFFPPPGSLSQGLTASLFPFGTCCLRRLFTLPVRLSLSRTPYRDHRSQPAACCPSACLTVRSVVHSAVGSSFLKPYSFLCHPFPLAFASVAVASSFPLPFGAWTSRRITT